jgi:hypothetical protein
MVGKVDTVDTVDSGGGKEEMGDVNIKIRYQRK